MAHITDYDDNEICLMAICQDNEGKPVPDAPILDFIGVKDDARVGYNCSYKTRKRK